MVDTRASAAATAQDWVNAMMYGQGAHSGQYMSGYGQSGLGAMLGGVGMAGPGLFGGGGSSQAQAGSMMMPALIANMLASAATPGIGMATSNLAGRGMMGLSAAGAFGNVQGGGGTGPGGFGLGGALAGITSSMEGLTGTGPRDLGMADVSRITETAGKGGFFNSVTSVRQVRERLKEMVSTVKSLSQELTMTIDEVSSGMNAMRGMGFNTASSAGTALRQLTRQAAAAGMAPSEMMAYSSQQGELLRQVAHIPSALATTAARNTLGFVGAGVRSGMVSEEALQNAFGASGEQGATLMSNRIQDIGLRMMNRAPMQFSMAAVMDPATGKLDQGRMNQLLTGGMSAGDIQRNANQYVGSLSGGYAQWLGQMPETRGQFMAAGGAMAPFALAATQMGQSGYNMDPNDPRGMAALSRVLSRQSGTRVDVTEARAFAEMYQNSGNIAEASAISNRRLEEQQGRSQIIADRFARRDPVYMLQEIQRTKLADTTSFIERQSTAMANRLERVSGNASGQGFDVMAGGSYWNLGSRAAEYSGTPRAERAEAESGAGWFRDSATDVEGRAAVEEINQNRDLRYSERRRLRGQAEAGVRAVEAEDAFYTKRYMGGEEARGTYAGTQEEARRGMGMDAGLAEIVRKTSARREAVVLGTGGASDEQRRLLEGVYGTRAVNDPTYLLEEMAKGTVEQATQYAAIMAGEVTEKSNAAYRLAGKEQEYSKEAGEAGRRARQAAQVGRFAQQRTGRSLGEIEYAAGTDAGSRYGKEALKERSVQETFAKAFEEKAKLGQAFVTNNFDIAAQIDEAIKAGITGETIGDIAKEAGNIDVTSLDENTRNMAIRNRGAFTESLGFVARALGEEAIKDFRTTGIVSDDQLKNVEAVIGGGGKYRKAVAAFGKELLSIGEALKGEGADAEAIRDRAAGALIGLARGGARAVREAQNAGILNPTLRAEADKLARTVQGGISASEATTVWEMTDADIVAASEGRITMEQINRSKRTGEGLEGLEMIVARNAVTPGQGGPETAAGRGGSADLATAFQGVLAGVTQGNALRVTFVGGKPTVLVDNPQEPPPDP